MRPNEREPNHAPGGQALSPAWKTHPAAAEKGAGFQVYPLVSRESDAPCGAGYLPVREAVRGCEHILFVDDEPQLAEVAELGLGRLGYTIDAFTEPEAALNAFSASPGRYDAIMTDLSMPTMTGLELVQKIRRIRPDMICIVCTGFSDTLSEKQAKELGIAMLAYKPLGTRDLAETIRRALGKTP